MKTPLIVFGILLIAIGGVWFLQGIGVLPGSFMTGQIEWAVIGTIAAVVGGGMLLLARRR
jgi:hypothetical protein